MVTSSWEKLHKIQYKKHPLRPNNIAALQDGLPLIFFKCLGRKPNQPQFASMQVLYANRLQLQLTL